jgi:hypothetical protein
MTPKLSEDQRQALRDHPGGPIPMEDEQTQQRYVLVDQGLHDRALEMLEALPAPRKPASIESP